MKRVLIVYGGGSVVKSGLLGRVEKSLADAGIAYISKGGVQPNPLSDFVYETKDDLLDFLIDHMPNPENLSDSDRRAQYDGWLSELKHWKVV